MRTLLQVELDTQAANQLMAEGAIDALMKRTMGELKPEAAYFFAWNGRRCMLLVFDLADEASIVPAVEPFWTIAGADVTLVPCMNADELQTGIGRFLGASA
jgi:hypothetical protein